MLRILAHAVVVIGLYLAFSFALFLGLQVNPLYGNMGVLACAVLAAFYVYIGFLRIPARPRKPRPSRQASRRRTRRRNPIASGTTARKRLHRRPHPSSASDSTNRTRSTCREMECFW